MNSREADKYVKKNNVWKKPDYQAMIDSGTPVDVAFFIKKVRDSLNAAPQYYRADDTPEKRLARQKQYIETVREVQGVMAGVKTRADAMRAYTLFLVDRGYVSRMDGISGPRYTATDKGQENPVITNKLARALHIRSESAFERDFTLGAQAEQFGVPKEDKVPRGYDIRFNDGKGSYSQSGDWQPNTYYVTKGYYNVFTYGDRLKPGQEITVNHSVSCMSTADIDSGYRGEIHAIVSNVGTEPQALVKGSRIGQLVIMPVIIADFVTETNAGRGQGAFGSTGE